MGDISLQRYGCSAAITSASFFPFAKASDAQPTAAQFSRTM